MRRMAHRSRVLQYLRQVYNSSMFSVSCSIYQKAMPKYLICSTDIGKDTMLKQRIFDNSTFSWADGPVNKQNIRVLDSDKIGLHSSYYADPIINSDSNISQHTPGIRLWVAKSETTFVQLAWRPGFSHWIYEQSWQDLNGHVDPAGNDLQPGHTAYVMFVDHHEEVNMYWFVHSLWFAFKSLSADTKGFIQERFCQ